MKKIIFILFIISTSAFAQVSAPVGYYQIASAPHGEITGYIDIKEDFKSTKISLISDETSFESHTIEGDLNSFEVKGVLKNAHEEREVTLKGNSSGVLDKEFGERKIALHLKGIDCDLKVLAKSPNSTATVLHKLVQDIIQ